MKKMLEDKEAEIKLLSIDEAINLILLFVENYPAFQDTKIGNAFYLGVDALERIKEGRLKGYDFFDVSLAGEADEQS